MACDCLALAAAIVVDEAAVVVAQAGVTVANQNLTAKQMQLWYDQYNFYLCGCGGEGPELADLESVKAAIVARDNNAGELAIMAQFPAMDRMHELVMVQINGKATS